MHREIASDSDQLERFRREARAVAQLTTRTSSASSTPARTTARPYIVFEYVEGETLKDRIRRLGRLPVDEARRLRDRDRPRARLPRTRATSSTATSSRRTSSSTRRARPRSPTSASRARSTRTGLTADGRVLGTTDYVSPEQALGHDVDGQSDIYSLGVVLFEMLTGDVPFHGENQVSVAMKHVREDLPDVAARRPEVSAALAAVLDRMTDKDLEQPLPRRRRRSIADLEDALAIEAARTRPRRPARRPPCCARCRPRRAAGCPFRLRHSLPACSPCSALLAVVAATSSLARPRGRRPHRSSGTGPGARRGRRRRATSIVSRPARVARTTTTRSATTRSTPTQARCVVDRDPGTVWTTERYPGRHRGRRQAGRRPLRRRQARRRRVADRDPDARRPAGQGDDLRRAARRRARSRRRDGWTKLGGGTVAGRRQALQARHRRRALPLLPRLDHVAAGGLRARRALRDRPVRTARGAEVRRTGAGVGPAGDHARRPAERMAGVSTEPAITDGSGYKPRAGFFDELFDPDGAGRRTRRARRGARPARPRGAGRGRAPARRDLHAAGHHVRRRRRRATAPVARPPVPARPRAADHPGRGVDARSSAASRSASAR